MAGRVKVMAPCEDHMLPSSKVASAGQPSKVSSFRARGWEVLLSDERLFFKEPSFWRDSVSGLK